MYLSPELKNIVFDIYIRRSSDDKDHQTASLPTQRDVLTKLVKESGLIISRIAEESKSAKQPGRMVFNEEIKRIEERTIQGLIVWDLSRLSRNPVDSGTLSWLLQREILKAIVTPQRNYLPEDNILLLNVEFGMANQYLRDLSRNVKRGLQNKLNLGWRPGPCPEGYLNNRSLGKGQNTIVVDKKRFSLVRKMWEYLFSGSYTVPEILKIGNEEWNYKTKDNLSLSRSGLYRIFTNPFYYGEYEYGGNWYTGKHKPMITKEEFDRCQMILGQRGKQRPKTREFSFTGMISCPCGCSITAEEKWQCICPNCKFKFSSQNRDDCPKCNTKIADMKKPTILHYIFYHCTRRRKGIKCIQKSVTVENLETQVDKVLSTTDIPEELRSWAIKQLNNENQNEKEIQTTVNQSLDEQYQNCLTEIHNLVDLKISPTNINGALIPEEEYKSKMKELQKKKKQLEKNKNNLGKRIDRWVTLSEDTFNFACYARAWFDQGGIKDKKIILQTIGSNLILDNKKLHLTIPRPFIEIKKAKTEAEQILKTFEPEEKTDRAIQLHALFSANPILRRGRDSNPRTPYEVNSLARNRFRPLSHLSNQSFTDIILAQLYFNSPASLNPFFL